MPGIKPQAPARKARRGPILPQVETVWFGWATEMGDVLHGCLGIASPPPHPGAFFDPLQLLWEIYQNFKGNEWEHQNFKGNEWEHLHIFGVGWWWKGIPVHTAMGGGGASLPKDGTWCRNRVEKFLRSLKVDAVHKRTRARTEPPPQTTSNYLCCKETHKARPTQPRVTVPPHKPGIHLWAPNGGTWPDCNTRRENSATTEWTTCTEPSRAGLSGRHFLTSGGGGGAGHPHSLCLWVWSVARELQLTCLWGRPQEPLDSSLEPEPVKTFTLLPYRPFPLLSHWLAFRNKQPCLPLIFVLISGERERERERERMSAGVETSGRVVPLAEGQEFWRGIPSSADSESPAVTVKQGSQFFPLPFWKRFTGSCPLGASPSAPHISAKTGTAVGHTPLSVF
ncbi:UNVERIFIED_CONTAM: hypothetical protein K2H54_023371 [Gekko kuhli]